MIKRKEFEHLFAPFNQSGKQIWVIGRVKELPLCIINMALNLAALEVIKFITVSDDVLAASSENYPNRPKVPITHMNHETAIGIQILYNTEHKTIDFFDINSPVKGHGSEMVDAVLKDLPAGWQPAVVMDWSDGFWGKIKAKYAHFEWIM